MIHRLNPTLVNQIAAGEVIERPASVVKELLENALDAAATHIVVELSFGGMNAITVSDNGFGIAEEELPLAVAPHATSKIKHLDDLTSIATMGFRGEALASIASVSRFSLQSKPKHQERAAQLTLENEKIDISPCARDTGTTVIVKDLFYNTPVRKRFLSSEKAEFLAIDRLIRCFALSAPEIKLDFYHQGNCIFQLPQGLNESLRRQRIQKILGKGFVDQALPIQATFSDLKINGFVGPSELARSQQDRLWTYVNRRMVNDKLLNHAIKHAYEDKLLPGRFPVCLIYLEIDPDAVDVNVHPTKHEVRFHQSRWVHDALRSTVANALSSGPNIKKEAEHPEQETYPHQHSEVSSSLETLGSVDNCFAARSTTTFRGLSAESMDPVSKPRSLGSEMNCQQTLGKLKPNNLPYIDFNWLTLNANFALLFHASTSYLLDLKRFYQAYLREQLHEAAMPLVSRPLFVPVSISLEKHIEVLEETFACLAQLGITLSWLGNQVLLVRSIPVIMPHLNLKEFILSVLSMSNLKMENIVNEIFQHQHLNAGVISDLEKQSWMAYLSTALSKQDLPYLRALSVNTCAAIFHE